MPKTALLVLALLAAGPAVQGQVGIRSDVSARTAQYRRLVIQFTRLNQQRLKDQRDAKTPEQKTAVQMAMSQLVREYATEFMAIASEAPQDATGLQTLGWVASRAAAGKEFDAALELLGEHHPGVTGLEVVCRRLFYHPSEKASKFLECVINENPQPGVRALARTALAIRLYDARTSRGDRFGTAKTVSTDRSRRLGKFNDRPQFTCSMGRVGSVTSSSGECPPYYEDRFINTYARTQVGRCLYGR